MKIFNLPKIPLASIGGFLAIVIFIVFTFAALMLYNGPYSPVNNWLSDLGNSSKNPSGHIYFDFGCILTGFAIIMSTAGLSKWKTINRKESKLIPISQYCGLLMAFSLIMVGVFSEDYGIIHDIWAAVFFVLLVIFMIIINIALRTHTKYIEWIWYYAIVSIFIEFIFACTQIIGLDIPILEWLAVLSGLVWIGLIGYNTLKLEEDIQNLNSNKYKHIAINRRN